MTAEEKLGRAIGITVGNGMMTAGVAWVAMLAWPHLIGSHTGFMWLWVAVLAAGSLISGSVRSERISSQ